MASRVLSGSGALTLWRGSAGSNQRPSTGPQLQEMTSAPWLAAQKKALASCWDPSWEIIRIGISLALGATPAAPTTPSAQATPAQAVPWLSPGRGRGSSSPLVASRGDTTLPALANSSWSMSTPSSMMANVTCSPWVRAWAAATLALALMLWPPIVVVARCHCCGNSARRPSWRTSSGWAYSTSSRSSSRWAMAKTSCPVPSGAAAKKALVAYGGSSLIRSPASSRASRQSSTGRSSRNFTNRFSVYSTGSPAGSTSTSPANRVSGACSSASLTSATDRPAPSRRRYTSTPTSGNSSTSSIPSSTAASGPATGPSRNDRPLRVRTATSSGSTSSCSRSPCRPPYITSGMPASCYLRLGR